MAVQHDEASRRGAYRLFESGFASPEVIEAHAERMAVSQRRLEYPTPDSGPGWVRIIHGANEDVLPVGGQTVGMVRHELGGLFNVAPGANGFLSGQPVAEGFVLRHGESLVFLQTWGRKGVGRVWTKEEFCDLFRMGEVDFDAMVARGLPVHRLEDGSVRITETQADEFLDRISAGRDHTESDRAESSFAVFTPLIAEVRRIADALNPPPPDLVDSGYVAGRLGCTTTWIADMARNGEIPMSCIVPGTGNGKPWKFRRTRIDEWIVRR